VTTRFKFENKGDSNACALNWKIGYMDEVDRRIKALPDTPVGELGRLANCVHPHQRVAIESTIPDLAEKDAILLVRLCYRSGGGEQAESFFFTYQRTLDRESLLQAIEANRRQFLNANDPDQLLPSLTSCIER
jgi:hypothetical protein